MHFRNQKNGETYSCKYATYSSYLTTNGSGRSFKLIFNELERGLVEIFCIFLQK